MKENDKFKLRKRIFTSRIGTMKIKNRIFIYGGTRKKRKEMIRGMQYVRKDETYCGVEEIRGRESDVCLRIRGKVRGVTYKGLKRGVSFEGRERACR